jgi:hypothetical protein
MTGSNDLDRMLTSYLDDGPRRAPERATDAAIAFAAAHPRRRDPLLVLKPDVMARRGSLFGPQLVWAALLVALTLGAVAAIAIGTRPSQEPVVPAPSPSVTESPSTSPSVAPSPTELSIELFDPQNDITWPVTITDASGTLVSAEPETQQDVPPVDRIEATRDPSDATRVELVWTFCGGPSPHHLTIDETGLVWRLERQQCLDTLGGADQRMTLVFSEPVDASALDVQLVETPG